MSLNDSLANAMSKIQSYDSLGRKEVVIQPSSKVLKSVLEIFNKIGYVGSFEEVEDYQVAILADGVLLDPLVFTNQTVCGDAIFTTESYNIPTDADYFHITTNSIAGLINRFESVDGNTNREQ